jgi:SAM-dependent methyltransferase
LARVKTHFNVSPAEYEEMRNGHVAQRCQRLMEQALLARNGGVRTVLEMGAGTGTTLARLAAAFPAIQFLGVDVEPKMVSYARERYQLPNLTYLLSDVTRNGSLPRCQFVFSVDFIHHIHEPLRCFRTVRAALDEGEVWLAIEPNIFNPSVLLSQERMRRAGYDEDHLRPWVIEPLLREAGFAIASRRFAFVFPGQLKRLPLPLRWIERSLERFRFFGVSSVYELVAR